MDAQITMPLYLGRESDLSLKPRANALDLSTVQALNMLSVC